MSTTRTRLAGSLGAVAIAALLASSCATTTSTATAADTTAKPTAETTLSPSTDLAVGTERSDLGRVLDELIEGTPFPAVGVTAFTADRIIESDVAGVRRVGDSTPVQLSDKFSIGSNAKAMSATLVATFVDDGLLEWETTIADVYGESIPGMDPTWGALTLRQLLSHTAGIDDHTLFAVVTDLDPDAAVTDQRHDALSSISTVALERPPGQYAYSNIGYTVVGAMLEELTGSSWEHLIQTRIFDPLGMDSCGFYAPGTPGQVDQPWGHAGELDGRPMDPGDPDADLPRIIAPAGMVHCNMADWVSFLQSQLRGFQSSSAEIISAGSFQAIGTPVDGSDYALGWVVVPGPAGADTLYHHGSNERFTAEVWLDPAGDWGLITVTNIGATIANPVLATIDRAMFDRRGNG